jgi:Transglutaminase-like superfamily
MRFIANGFLFLRIFAFAAAVPYLLRLKLSRVARALEPGKDPSAVDENRVRKITAHVERAIRRGKPLVRPGCLTRGLTRYYFLRRSGMDVALCFGMGRLGNEFVGHCWLVKDGEPYLEPRDQDPRSRYTEMYRISRTASPASGPAGVGRLERFPGL